ncbi:MAG: hypothetical protein KDC01_00230 [Flavobacteriales bacterium]|nr:hypothetical protein [Flavobacteriales bacterium]
MKTRNLPRPSLRFVAVFAIATCIAPTGSAQKHTDKVTIRGQVLVSDTARSGTLEVVEVDNHYCVPLVVHSNGRFELVLEAGNKAYLRFEKDGYLTKEVLVDTHNANITREAVRKNKMLRFAVQMTPELPDKRLHYAAPVGIISFLNGTGLMKVRYDRRLVRRSDGDIVAN